MRIALTIVDTPGFGDNIDNEFACVFFVPPKKAHHSGFCSVSRRLWATSSANTTTFSRRSLVSSVTPASATTECTLCSTSSLRRAMREFVAKPTHIVILTYGYSLREMDIELMRRLSPRVNVIPVVGKADSLTPSELRGFKKRVCIMSSLAIYPSLTLCVKIMEDIEHYDIPVYNFPYDVEEDDEDTIQDNSELRVGVYLRTWLNYGMPNFWS